MARLASVPAISPSGNQRAYASLNSSYRTSGTPQSGTYTRTFSLPQFAEQGVWAASVSLYDVLSNDSSYSTVQLSSAGFQSQLKNGP